MNPVPGTATFPHPPLPPGAAELMAQMGERHAAGLDFEDLGWQLALLYAQQEFVPVVREWNLDIGAGVRKAEKNIEEDILKRTGQTINLQLNRMVTEQVVKPFIAEQIDGPVDTPRERVVALFAPAFLP